MSFISGVRSFMDNLFVPRDGLYRQAQELIAQHDSDGDGRINVAAVTGGPQIQLPFVGDLLNAPGRGFEAADRAGNGDGVATVREVRNLLKRYDVGSSARPDAGGDGTLDGVEGLRMMAELTAPAANGAAAGASRGAEQLAA